MSLSCTLVPAPNFGVEPNRIRTCPERTFANSSAFFVSVAASWIKAICSLGIPIAASFSRTSSYTLKIPPAFGVDRSQKMICADLSCMVFFHIPKAFSTQRFALLPSASGSISFKSRWSSAHFLPSLVIRSMLSSAGSTPPARTASARCANAFTISCCSGLGFNTSFTYSASGTGRSNRSAVWISAHSLNSAINSGRL